jgi:DnaK suppressor protein
MAMAQGLPITCVNGWCGDTGDATPASRQRKERQNIVATTTKTIAPMPGTRDHDLRKMLEDRRSELMREVQGRIRDARTDITKDRQVLDQGESSEVDIQEDIEFALIQMKAETLNKIDVALRRLNDDTYGVCFECGDEIAERRLRALPFAVRCKDCEEARETAQQRESIIARRGSSSLVVEVSS